MEDFQNCVVRHPYEPSLDRKDSSQGYTVSNTRLVCVAVNFGLNQWGDSVYFELARAAAEHGKVADLERSNRDWIQRQQARIENAERLLANGADADKVHLEHVLAGYRAALTKGREALSIAARIAVANRKPRQPATVLSKPSIGDAGPEAASMRAVRWVVSDERLDNLGHGVQFLHDEIQSGHPVAFLESFNWMQKNGSGPATVILPRSCPTTITADRWSEIIQSARDAVLVFLSKDSNLQWSFRHGRIHIRINA